MKVSANVFLTSLLTFGSLTLLSWPVSGQVLRDSSRSATPVIQPAPQAGDGFSREAQVKPQQKFYFADCVTSGDFYGMWLLDSLGDTVQHVSSRPGFASWSSDQLRMVCIDPRRRLKILDLGKPQQGLLINLPEGYFPDAPAWSPTEDRIAFTVIDSTKRRRVYLVNADKEGSGLVEVTTGDAHYSRPAWWPNGLKLLISRSSPKGNRTALINLSLETGKEEVVYESDSLPLVNGIVSPDGEYIIAESPTDGNLYRLSADGSEMINLTRIGSRLTPFANARFSTVDPGWITCAGKRNPQGSVEIFRIPIQGGAFVPITKPGDGMNFIYAAPNM